jgi:hypothetical protein
MFLDLEIQILEFPYDFRIYTKVVVVNTIYNFTVFLF